MSQLQMPTYDEDIAAWSEEQARLLRAGQLDRLDLEQIAEEIEDLSRREQRELMSRIGLLIGHLLKWAHQKDRRSPSWERTIKAQRKEVAYLLRTSPSLKPKLADPDWIDVVWSKAVALAVNETGLDCFPEVCCWSLAEQVLDEAWWPDA